MLNLYIILEEEENIKLIKNVEHGQILMKINKVCKIINKNLIENTKLFMKETI